MKCNWENNYFLTIDSNETELNNVKNSCGQVNIIFKVFRRINAF